MAHKLVGLAGSMEVGKTTAANNLVATAGFIKLAFADPVKEVASVLFNVPRIYFDTRKNEIDPFWGISYRSMLQKLGTDCVRVVFGFDFWIRRAEVELNKHPDSSLIVFDDVRFKEEVDWIRSKDGIIIKISNGVIPPYAESEVLHDSEIQQLQYDTKCYNTNTKEKLYELIKSILTQRNIL